MLNKFGWASIFLLAFLSLYAQKDSVSDSKRTYVTKALPVGEVLEIDGTLNDKGWNVVPWECDFTVFDPNNGETPSQLTKFKIT